MNKRQQKWLLLAVVAAAVPAIFGVQSARAQYPVGDDGHALDANNFSGSKRNDPAGNRGGTASGNQIVTGNVTGGKAFRGVIQYTDPRAFRGTSSAGHVSDAFVRDSYGTPARNSPAFSLDGSRTFYGVARAVSPPSGTVRQGFSGGYVGTTLQPVSGGSLVSPLAGLRDQRLGGIDIVGVQPGTIPQGNQLELPPPGLEQGSLYLRTPFLGTRALQNGLATGSPILPTGNAVPPAPPPGSGLLPAANGYVDRFAAQAPGIQPLGTPETPVPPGQTPSPIGVPPANPNQLPGRTPAPLNVPLGTVSPAGNPAAQEAFLQRMIVPPKEQSAQYKELQQRFDRANSQRPPTPEEANRQFRQLRAQQQAAQANPTPGQTPPASGPPAVTAPGGLPEAVKPHPAEVVPTRVNSLATLVKPGEVHDILESAENLMRDGQFRAALEKYDAARRLAPSNPLVSLGRANAELGTSLYPRAIFDFRRAFTADPSLVTAQYDLKSMMGSRLPTTEKELQALAKSDTKTATPMLLLAYLAYNSGNPANAARYLDEAQKRVGKDDSLLQLMQSHWALPQTPQELNK